MNDFEKLDNLLSELGLDRIESEDDVSALYDNQYSVLIKEDGKHIHLGHGSGPYEGGVVFDFDTEGKFISHGIW